MFDDPVQDNEYDDKILIVLLTMINSYTQFSHSYQSEDNDCTMIMINQFLGALIHTVLAVILYFLSICIDGQDD